ncbi:MAG: glycine/betaine/sarcosine/D-proline family reductase selenoprotein B [Firmicutes bacterium]|nr:glycine/betaine/sarcosine/D-proline family reductase selenoprotein B [Bacillota bacterium]
MENQRWRIVCYINQFFGQLGGEEQADIGFLVKEGPIGPAGLLQSLLGDKGDVVATVICGDNYMAENLQAAVDEGVKIVADLKPTVFFAGPAFNAGRYGVACGAIASAVQERLGVPAVTGLYPENPGAEMYRKKVYVVKTGINAAKMKDAMTGMAAIGRRLLLSEPIGSAEQEGYLPRGILRNEWVEKPGAVRGIDMLLDKIAGRPFQTELSVPHFEEIPPAPPVKDIRTAKIALVSDGGVVPKGNPDKFKVSQNTVWAVYGLDEIFSNPFQISHSGYHPTEVRENLNRLLPLDVLREMESEGLIGSLSSIFYSTSGNTTTVQSSRNVGQGIAQRLLAEGVDAAILTST